MNRHKDLARFHEAIALAIFYYNTERIHLALKMSPAAYAATLIPATPERDRVLQTRGA
ncbi:MAG TPA: hypothetical protein VLF40_01835 [Candidatus Saccharimonadales bacterium]|nr:hypothetical protein [Candidatus Saccharimonadales bacterium]